MSVDPAATPNEWIDARGRHWSVELPPEHVVLHSDGQTIEVPAAQWRADVYIAPHGDGFIVRFERFDSSLGFMLTREQAMPLLAHLGVPTARQVASQEEAPAAPQSLLWPTVSPLAIWALICSSLVFVPVLGLLPAAATIILLVLHRARVRRSAAYSHSRAVCVAAFVFLVAGAMVSALATWGLLEQRPFQDASPAATTDGKNVAAIVFGLFVVLLSLSVHEAAHAITAWWLGDGLAKSLGRVTLNPLSHIDPFGTVLLPALLSWAGGPVFGYARPVPVHVEALPRWRRAHILIALAGPGSNLLLACASLALLLALGCLTAEAGGSIVNFSNADLTAPVTAPELPLGFVIGPLCMVLRLSFFTNVALALFNLIPIPPLDGSWVLEHLFPNTLGRLYGVIRPFGVFVFLAAIYYNVFDFLVYPLLAIILPALLLLRMATGM